MSDQTSSPHSESEWEPRVTLFDLPTGCPVCRSLSCAHQTAKVDRMRMAQRRRIRRRARRQRRRDDLEQAQALRAASGPILERLALGEDPSPDEYEAFRAAVEEI